MSGLGQTRLINCLLLFSLLILRKSVSKLEKEENK